MKCNNNKKGLYTCIDSKHTEGLVPNCFLDQNSEGLYAHLDKEAIHFVTSEDAH